MRKTVIFLMIILLVLPLLPSCAENERPSCRYVLEELKKCEVGLPSGKTYDLLAPEGNDEYLSEKLLSLLYGNGSMPPIRSGWLDIAIFLPASQHPCEFAVILCNSPDTATDTARLLLRRLDIIRSAKKEYDNLRMLDSAVVTIVENYVLLIISSDKENSLRLASSLIK